MKKSYKHDRNGQIYEDYIGGNGSYNELARKYSLTPQRIQAIVSHIRTNQMGTKLSLDAEQKEREQAKDLAVELREHGDLQSAENLFKQIIEWDEKHENFRGMNDVLGHLKIISDKLADNETNPVEKLKYYDISQRYLEKCLVLSHKYNLPKDRSAITRVHLALLMLKRSSFLQENQKEKSLVEALGVIDEALIDLPGSQAHRSWPLNGKAKILLMLKRYSDVLETLQEAERALYVGYDEEMGRSAENTGTRIIANDQARMKLNVWHANLFVTYAKLYSATDKPILAKHYASAVMAFDKKDKSISSARTEAQKILNELV